MDVSELKIDVHGCSSFLAVRFQGEFPIGCLKLYKVVYMFQFKPMC